LDHIKNSPRTIAGSDGAGITGPPVHELILHDPNDINRQSEWDIDFRQIESGPMETRVVLRPSRNVTLIEIHMDRAVHQQGCSPIDAVTLGLVDSSALRSWHGTEFEAPGLLNFGSGSEYESVNSADFVGLTVSISEPFLVQVSEKLGLPLPDNFLRKTTLPVRRRSAALRQLTAAGRSLLYRRGARFGELEQDDFVAGLVSAAADAEKFDDRSDLSVRTRAVRLALDCMKDRLGENVPISEICASTGVSWRTLDRGFREQFGIGPKAYLNRFRLGRVRAALLRKRSDTSVADAANEWGFWHMGQFARDYKRMFGELPSATEKANSR
jgi:AraC-like DNA-binding protein